MRRRDTVTDSPRNGVPQGAEEPKGDTARGSGEQEIVWARPLAGQTLGSCSGAVRRPWVLCNGKRENRISETFPGRFWSSRGPSVKHMIAVGLKLSS